jgi:hypothetical protein
MALPRRIEVGMRYLLLFLLLVTPAFAQDDPDDTPPEPSSCDVQIQRWMVPVHVYPTSGGTCADPLADPDSCHTCNITLDDDVRMGEVTIKYTPDQTVRTIWPAIIGKHGEILRPPIVHVLITSPVAEENVTYVDVQGGVE